MALAHTSYSYIIYGQAAHADVVFRSPTLVYLAWITYELVKSPLDFGLKSIYTLNSCIDNGANWLR